MTAVLLSFKSRRAADTPVVSNAAYEPATVAGGRMVCFTPQQGQNNPARKVIIARIQYRIPPHSSLTPAGNLAAETGAYCCHLSGPFSQGALADLSNFCRSLTGWSFRVLLKSFQESRSRVCNWFKTFRGLLRHVDEHDTGVTQNVGKIDQRRGFFSQGASSA
jgi:hypothetical protein